MKQQTTRTNNNKNQVTRIVERRRKSLVTKKGKIKQVVVGGIYGIKANISRQDVSQEEKGY